VIEAVDGPHSVRAALERHTASDQFVAAVVCASDPATAATLIWELGAAGNQALFGARVLVLLRSMRQLAALPKRLQDAFEFIGMDELGDDEAIAGVLDRVDALARAPRPVDLLASVYRSAISRRSLDGLLTIHATVGQHVEVDPRELASTARVGDRGPRPNPLWAHWISHGRSLQLADPDARRSKAPIKKSRK
jgi:hypothetical protein